jgi:hypothetical protein
MNNNIYNNNNKNIVSQSTYNHFNDFIFSNDIKILGKLLHRYDFFCKTKDLPGDIVEVGVFKGSGMATFSKFLDIYCPNSNKKIIGFDIFDPENSDKILKKYNTIDNENMNLVYSRVESNDRTLESVNNKLEKMCLDKKYILVEGDVEDTIPDFLEKNPGFRISYLYIDVDIERPTYIALKYFWDRILPGGIIVFDEYEYHKFSESGGVDLFLKENKIKFNLKSTNFMAPTSYLVKEDNISGI